MTAVLWMRSADSERHGTPFSYAVAGCDNEYLIYDYQQLWVWIQCVEMYAGVAVNDGAWHQIAFAWSNDSGQAELYVDDDPVFSAAVGEGQDQEDDGVLVFGQEQDTPGGGFVAGQAFQGHLDEIRIYDRALSEEEVQALYNNPGRLISQVAAAQGWGAYKAVDTDYALGGGEDTRTITLQISSDAGETWDIFPTAVWGDIGEGVVSGDDKHIVWKPAIDIPGVSGDDFMVRVIADDVYYADSNVFSIVAAGPGGRAGRGQRPDDQRPGRGG